MSLSNLTVNRYHCWGGEGRGGRHNGIFMSLLLLVTVTIILDLYDLNSTNQGY